MPLCESENGIKEVFEVWLWSDAMVEQLENEGNMSEISCEALFPRREYCLVNIE